MIIRVWHGWTTYENAPRYEQLLKTEIFPGIANKAREMSITGYKKIQLVKRNRKEEVEFMTLMTFESLEDIKKFAGNDYEKAYVPDTARKILASFDEESQHYELVDTLSMTE